MSYQEQGQRRLTDSARTILSQIRARAGDRGLHVVDAESILLLVLWSLLLWERKLGRVALEQTGVDPFNLARGLDTLLRDKAREHPVVHSRARGIVIMARNGEPYEEPDFDALLEPLLKEAEQESQLLGQNYVGSEHLVLAITRIAPPSLVSLFQQHGITYEAVLKSVRFQLNL